MYANRSSSPRPLSLSLARFGSAAAVCAALSLASAHRASAAPAAWDVGPQDGVITSGSGNWNFADANFTDLADTIAHFAWNNVNNAGDTVVFGGTGGVGPFTITLDVGGINAGGLQFDTLGYTLTGGGLNLGNAATITTNVDAEIRSVITANGLTSSGAGSLLLRGANGLTLTGQYTIGSGTMVIAASNSALANDAVLGTTGIGNETIVSAGGTLDVGGSVLGGEIIHIAGAGVGGRGALTNSGVGLTAANDIQFLTLTGNATVNAQGQYATNLASGFGTSYGRLEVRTAAFTAGAQNLNLAGFTLTKTGRGQFSLVNADVTTGNIVINDGVFGIEANTQFGAGSTITVNAPARLGFFGLAATAVVPNITMAGGSIGEVGNSAAQTLSSNISMTTAPVELWANTAAGTTFSGVISGTIASGVTEIAKRGSTAVVGNLITLNNIANSFDAPVAVYQGILRADYLTGLGAGGVPGAAPLTSTDTPLGTNGTIKLAGGTLTIRVNMDNNNTQQVFDLQRSLVVDLAPGAMTFDRLSNTTQTDKHVLVSSVTFAPASAANGYSIGQNQLTFTQANTHRLQMASVTMGSDTVFATGDHTLAGNVLSAGRNSLARTGANTTQFIAPGTHEFNAFFDFGGSLRVGSGFGTPVTNATVTVGSGPVFLAPGAGGTWRTPTNIAAGQTIEVVSQRVTHGIVNFEQFTSVPTALRANDGGVLGLGNATAFGDIDLSTIGDGTFRIGAGFIGSGNGVITGTIKPGAGGMVRMGAGNAATSVVTVSGTDRITGSATLEVGSSLINGGFTTSGNGTVVLAGANNYTGGTTVNRSSVLRIQSAGSLGTGAVTAFGSVIADGAAGTFINGISNQSVSLNGGSTLRFDSSALTTGTDTDRWLDTQSIALNNSVLQLDARNNNSTTNETVGPISFTGGSTISLQRNNVGASQIVQLQTPSFTRTGTGTLEITRSGSSGFGSNVKLLATTTAPTVTNGMVAPFMTLIDATRLQNFATYDGVQGFINATYTNTVNTAAFPAGLSGGTQIVYVDFAAAATTTTLSDNPVIYALKVGAGAAAASATTIATGGGTVITLRSGGLIVSGDGTAGNFSVAGGTQTTINPNLSFNNGVSNIEGLVNVRTGTTAFLNGLLAANGLTKSGAGTLNLTANNGGTLAGSVTVNQGTLQLFGPTATGVYNVGGTGSVVLAGGQLNLRSNNSAVTGTINPTMQMGLTVAAGIPIATLDVNRSGADTASTGTFNFQYPGPTLLPGLQLLGAPGPQGQTFTVSGANYNVTFGTFALNSSHGNITYNITGGRTLQLDRSPTITGTAPIITKSGDGTLIYARAFGLEGAVSPAGTRIVVNAGVLEPRSIQAFGTVATATIELNGGQLNLRRDNTTVDALIVWSGNTVGSGPGYPVVVNGNSTISADRLGTTQTNIRLGLGATTLNGNPTLTATSGNGYSVELQSLQLNGLPTFSSSIAPGNANTAFRISGVIAGGGFVKSNTGHMHLYGVNTYDGGTWINQGILRARGFAVLGTGAVTLNPGGILDFNSTSNMNSGQPLIVRGNSSFIPMISMNTDNPHPTTDVDTSAAPVGIIGLSNGTAGIYDTPIDMAALYGGNWYLGGISTGAYDARYTAETLGVGAGNTYRLGGGGLAFIASVDSTNVPRNNLLTGGARVVYGFDSGNLRGANGTTFQFVMAGTQDYGGGTLINRGTVTRIVSANDGTYSGLSIGPVEVFGNLAIGTDASLAKAGGLSTNSVTLHPGSALHLDNNNAGGLFGAVNNPDRWGDNTPIALNGALLDLVGANAAASTETVGDVTYSRGARIRSGRGGTGGSGTTTLTLANLTAAAGKGNTLTLQTFAAGTLGNALTGDRILITGTAPAVTNGMVSPQIVNGTDNTFVTYGATDGFANVTYDTTVAGDNTTPVAIPTGLAATTKLDISTGAVVLADNPTIYALRTNRNINVGGANSTITIRSGGLIANAPVNNTSITLQPRLVFNDGASDIEARIYTTNFGTGVVNLNGSITANGITKFGTGTLNINVAQPDYASGWTVNAGTLQINDLGGLGQSVPGNAVTLNATQTTSGSAGQQLGITNLTFARNTGSPELGVFSGGPITVINEGTIRVAGGDDRNLQIPNVTLQSTGSGLNSSGVGFTFDVPNNRYRATIPTLTLASNATVRVFDSGATADTGRVTAGVVNSLVGTGVVLNKIGNRTLELAGDNSATFTGGSIVIGQGTVRVLHNGSLGSATTTATIERNATLEIGVANFAPIATLNQLPGSIERWNLETARPSIYTLPAGVNLQLNTNLLGAHTIGLNGGSIEGFLWIDHPVAAVQRTIGSTVGINLLADSFVGQNVLLGQGYDLGRQPTLTGPFGDNVTGSYLRIDGSISGAFNLTKTGLDTVTLGSNSNAYNDTRVDMGTLRLGIDNALPVLRTLTTRYAGALDLNGFNQFVAGLGTKDTDPVLGAVSVGSSGRIVNSATTISTLTVSNSDDFTYNGVIDRTVSLVKTGSGILTIAGANTHSGDTKVSAGTLRTAVSNTLSPNSVLDMNGGTVELFATDQTVAGLKGATGTIQNGGALTVDQDINTTYSGAITGPMTLIKDGDGMLTLNGLQDYLLLIANDGTTNVDSALGTGSSAITANTGSVVNIRVSQELASLAIGDGATVILTDLPGPGGEEALGSPVGGTDGSAIGVDPGGALAANSGQGLPGASSDIAAVPEPGSLGLLAAGVLGLLRRRRKT